MAGDWIKVECTTPDKPEMVALANALGIDQDAAVGKCLRVWIWADQQSTNGNALSVTESFLDRITYCAGFASAMKSVGWLVSDGDKLTLPHFDRHNGQTAKTRALTRDRVKSSRSKRNQRNVESVTTSLPEKRREEISGSDVVIPEKLREYKCTLAASLWFDYLIRKGLDDKVPESNSPQMQAFWDNALKTTRSADGFCDAVEFTMANGWRTLTVRPANKKAKASGEWSEDWIETQKIIATTAPSETEKRNKLLGPQRLEAVKRIGGSAKVRDANDFELKSLGTLFESHLSDIRKAGNGSQNNH